MNTKVEFSFGLQKNALSQDIPVKEARQALSEIRRVALELFGGYTFFETHGGWLDNGTVFQERGGVLAILTDDPSDRKIREAVKMLADVIKGTLAQRAVCVTISQVNTQML